MFLFQISKYYKPRNSSVVQVSIAVIFSQGEEQSDLQLGETSKRFKPLSSNQILIIDRGGSITGLVIH